MLNNINNNRGMILGVMLASMFMLSSAIVLSSRATDTVRSAQRYFSGSSTKNSMAIVRDFLIQRSADVDNDGHFELLKEASGNTIPLAIPINPVDNYGTAYRYCTWDAGALNSVDATYSQNNAAPPVAGLIGRIISGGSDRIVSTDCAAVVADGDDILLEILENAVSYSNAALGGWADKGDFMAQLNPTDKIITGSAAIPTHQLEVMGGNTAANGLAIGNVEIFNSGGNSAQINVTGGFLNINGGGLQISAVQFVDASRNVTAGNVTVGGTLTVTGATVLNGTLTANSGIATTTLSTSGMATLNSLAVTNNATISGTLTVTGGLTASGGITTTTLSTSGAATLNSLAVTNNATVGGSLTVTGAVNLAGGNFQMAGTNVINSARNLVGINAVAQNLIPLTNSTYNLGGGAGSQFLNIYGQNIYQNGNKVIDSSTLTGTANYITKFTGANSVGNSQLYDNGTNVLIATAVDNSSGAKMQVAGGLFVGAGATGALTLSGTGSTNANSPILNFWGGYAAGRTSVGPAIQGIASGAWGMHDLVFFQHNAADYLTAYEAMRLTAGGNLLLGTGTDNGSRLNINGSGYFNAGAAGSLILTSSASTNDNSPSLAFFGDASGGKLAVGPAIQGISSGDYGRHDLVFRQHNADDYTTSAEAMRLSKAGNLLMGTISDDGINKMQIVGGLFVRGSVGFRLEPSGALTLSSTNTGDNSPSLNFWGATEAGATSVGPSIQGVASPINATFGRHDLVFRQHDGDDYTSVSDSMRLTYRGNLLIGHSVDDGVNKLQVAGGINLSSGSLKFPDGSTQNSGSGTAKAWVRWSWPNTIQSSYNVASITNNGNGTVTIAFATAMADSNYAVSLSSNNSAADAQQRGLVVSGTPTAASVTVAAPVSQSICSAVIFR